jgi:broad specificity phosphatase PhoE
MATRLHLVRHGQTDWNKESVFRGRADKPLNMTGKREGLAVAFALEDTSLAGIYASPLIRAVQTLEETADRHGQDVKVVEDLTDIDFGDWQGRAKDEVAREDPDGFRTWLENPSEMRFPGGESLVEAAGRAAKAVEELASKHEGRQFAVCTHRVICKILVCRLVGIDLSRFWSLKIDTASITVLNKHQGRWILEKLNSDFHLAPLADERVTEDF